MRTSERSGSKVEQHQQSAAADGWGKIGPWRRAPSSQPSRPHRLVGRLVPRPVPPQLHDGFGGISKNAMRKAEKHGTYIIGAAGVVKFLDNFFNHIQDKSLEDYFAKWTPYRVRRVHVKLIGRHDIYRPTPVLEGIKGTQSMYLFEGADSNTCDAQTTTASMEDDVFLALGVELASDVSSAEVESAGLSVRKVTGPVPSGVGREGGGLEEEG